MDGILAAKPRGTHPHGVDHRNPLAKFLETARIFRRREVAHMENVDWLATGLLIAAVIAVGVVVLWVIIARENRRTSIWIADPQRELELHNTAVREKTWGGTTEQWEKKVERSTKQYDEK
jgi:hypothetical protein